jgi:hypothetical protein
VVQPSFDALLKRLDLLCTQCQELRDGIRQAVTIAEQDPEMSLTRARKVLEYMVRHVYERRLAEEPGTRPLENLLQRLVKEGDFPKRLAAYANAIRELGNVGTHSFGERVTAADVLQSLTQLLPIVEWYFEQDQATGSPSGTTALSSPTPGELAHDLGHQPSPPVPTVRRAATGSPFSGPAATPSAATPSPPAGGHGRWWTITAAAAAVVLVALGVVLVNRGPPPGSGPSGSSTASPPPSTPTAQALSPALRALLQGLKDPDPAIRAATSRRLKDLQDPAVVPALKDRVADDLWSGGTFAVARDPVLGGKGDALSALRKLAPDQVPGALVRALQSKNRSVQLWAAEELGKTSAEPGHSPDAPRIVVDALVTALSSRNGPLRRQAAQSLKQLRAISAVPALKQRVADDLWVLPGALGADPEAGGKAAALDALKSLAPDQVAGALEEATKSKHPQVKRWALSEINTGQVPPG